MRPYLPNHKLVILDDDPTGVQTVHDIYVYTDWSIESIRSGFLSPKPLFFILTNSRSFTREQTEQAHEEIAQRIWQVSRETGIPFLLISRSDSTLRGHYPLETEVLRRTLEEAGAPSFDGEILCPFFLEGGRLTIDNIHYVKYGEKLVPAAETEFAKDKTFGYHSSDMRSYIEEKTDGRYPASGVICVSLELLRSGNIAGIHKLLLSASGFQKIVVNAEKYSDLEPFCQALALAVKDGRNYLFRTAASIVKVLGGVPDKPLLAKDEMKHSDTPGLVVVGSHTQKSTAQLMELLTLPCVQAVPFHSNLVLEGEEVFRSEITRARKECETVMRSGKTAVVYTERTLLVQENDTKESALLRSVRISDGLQTIVKDLEVTPSFLIAKGGITSSDVATKALAVRQAFVLGQVQPGIPVWQIGEESLFPHMPYVIFPGNVGDEDTLKKIVEILS
jgi:uncharacterized protein YgbK (DUF1537 family)